MGIENNKPEDNIVLQNMILGIDEKKLKVSREFLENMTKVYISKRMRKVNDAVSSFSTLTDLKKLLAKYDYVYFLIDELAKLEPVYTFIPPIPTEYKKQLEEKKPDFITQLIVRTWKILGYNTKVSASEEEIRKFFDDIKALRDLMPVKCVEFVNELHSNVYGYGLDEVPPENAKADGADDTGSVIDTNA